MGAWGTPGGRQFGEIVTCAREQGTGPRLDGVSPKAASYCGFLGLTGADLDLRFPVRLRGLAGVTSAPRKACQRSSSRCGAWRALAMARSATSFTIQSKFAWPTDSRPASGAGFMKSMA